MEPGSAGRKRDSATLGEPDYEPNPEGPLKQVEIWRLKDPATRNSIDESRRLVPFAKVQRIPTVRGRGISVPAISPNHVAILSPAGGGCPAAPPKPAHDPDDPFVRPPTTRGSTAKVTILDSGYIWIDPPHRNLDRRVTVVRGQRLDTSTTPASWEPDSPDGLYTDPAGQLDGISGHGTFIAGLIAHIAPRTRLEVVGLRNQEVEIPDHPGPGAELGLFETEVAIAHAMLRRCHTDVIQCGFAFPTLDDYPSLPFAAVMAELRAEHAPHRGRVAVVAPAGNEQSRRRFWPAALPSVIGVASTNRRGNARAWFSNWGDWCQCCTRGEYVYSTFIRWDGPIEGEPLTEIEHFHGWARWDGTSFAAPKVSAAIARLFAERDSATPPLDAGNELIAGTGGVAVSPVTDATLSGAPGVTLPYLQVR
jgi:Subtilase family